ncbi:MAG: GNAT family N-acetyltransferase [Pseudomonadota bacterium]|nr:GNAT family N-acetyltransferase [Pseudomonadota bacterium]
MLRLATPADTQAVYAIYMHPEVIPFLGYDAMSQEDFGPVFQELVDCRSFYIMEREASIAGFCRTTRHPGRASHVATLGTLAVSPRWHGTGIAMELVNQIIAMLAAQGILRVELMLETDNPRAFAFYSKLGFRQEGLMRAAYKRSTDAHYMDEILMAKLLGDLRQL